jgi:branched-chain amino acid transport system substrate-binding protein
MSFLRLPFTVVGLAIAVNTVGCVRNKPESEQHGPTLVVGAILSLSGGAATYGQDADRGARLALEQINAEGENKLKVIYKPSDDKSSQTEAQKVATSLIDVEKVHVLLGPAISPSALSVGKLAQERRVPIVATSATQNEITFSTDYDRTYVFRVCFSDDQQARLLAKFAVASLQKRIAVVVYDKTLSYSVGLSKSFRDEYARLGGTVAHEENYSVKDTDYSALIAKVADYDADLLFIAGWDENVGPMLKQAGKKWAKFTLLGADGWPTETLLRLSGGNTLSSYAVSHFAMRDTQRPMVQKFIEAFRAKYHEDPSPFAALGYDAMMLIFDAAIRSESLTPEHLRESIARTNGLELVTTESLRWDEHRNPIKAAYIVRINSSSITFHEEVTP